MAKELARNGLAEISESTSSWKDEYFPGRVPKETVIVLLLLPLQIYTSNLLVVLLSTMSLNHPCHLLTVQHSPGPKAV